MPEHVLAGVVSSPDDDVATAATSTARRALALVQSWLTDDRYAAARLVLVTRGAVPAGAGEGVSDLAAAPVWGLVRSAQTEHPGRFVLIDLDDDETSLTALPAALSTGEPQLAIRRGKTSVPRLTADRAVPQLPDGSWHLRAAPETGLDGLSPAPSDVATRPLGEHEVRIDVRAAGLNFRDVLLSLGMYPDADDVPMGSEGAGVVVEVGSRVSTVKVGDRVMGLAPGWFGDRTITDECVVVGVPLGWSWVEAASVPVAFVTALYALRELAGLGVGESVLVHGAAGGVGMAAVQVARWLGAEVFATAAPVKWGVVRGWGWMGRGLLRRGRWSLRGPSGRCRVVGGGCGA
ncbi:hypothetical protein SVIO_025730 [Streptomyces violaceusniger]|uniref:Enoyl reductase (ER) domain-containing protein n=1 Tax=Streptomyces violaceusniger TaxID=68280 RepID=A0A4D4KZJ1_STRVO|nr:hypothetical protein SVIO_025730 [Streptomyces violaceusniger]